MSRLLDIATAEIGTEEIVGDEHNPRVLQYAHEAGFDWVKSDEVPWCSIFLNWVAHKAGFERTKDGRSRSWANIGTPVTDPQPGDVILVGTDGRLDKIYHVGLLTGFSSDGQQVFCLGGNQTNRVSVTRYWRKNIAGFRRIEPLDVPLDLTEEPEVPLPDPEVPGEIEKVVTEEKAEDKEAKDTITGSDARKATAVLSLTKFLLTHRRLQYGSRGDKVEELQIALNEMGYQAGVEDGIFGRKTEAALRNFQRDEGLRPTGKLDRKVRRRLRRRLML
ncbi:MAG: TIGR02594 family protein [Bacteroidota bacterium]